MVRASSIRAQIRMEQSSWQSGVKGKMEGAARVFVA